MLLGMGTVLVFLVVLIFVTKGMSSIVKKIEAKKPQVATATPSKVSSVNAAPNTSADAEIAAAIVAAVAKSRE
ncbi:MAG: OadG family protein [Pleomorphochaeta sp.]